MHPIIYITLLLLLFEFCAAFSSFTMVKPQFHKAVHLTSTRNRLNDRIVTALFVNTPDSKGGVETKYVVALAALISGIVFDYFRMNGLLPHL